MIVKPINEFRIGFAVHTPTWHHLSSSSYAGVDYSYYNPGAAESKLNPIAGTEETDDAYYNFHLNSPWKIMVGAAAVIGNQAIVSLDYERQAYNNTKVSYQDQRGDYVSDDYVNDDTKAYFKAANIFRLGVEYRLTPAFSLRAGYNYTSTSTKEDALNGNMEIFTAEQTPPTRSTARSTPCRSVLVTTTRHSMLMQPTFTVIRNQAIMLSHPIRI